MSDGKVEQIRVDTFGEMVQVTLVNCAFLSGADMFVKLGAADARKLSARLLKVADFVDPPAAPAPESSENWASNVDDYHFPGEGQMHHAKSQCEKLGCR